MRLTDLSPKWGAEGEAPLRTHLILRCPKCGQHAISVRFAGAGKFVWALTGTDFSSLSLQPSVQEDLTKHAPTCGFHFVVVGGEVTNC